MIVKALYGLQSSSLHFHDKLGTILCTVGFTHSFKTMTSGCMPQSTPMPCMITLSFMSIISSHPWLTLLLFFRPYNHHHGITNLSALANLVTTLGLIFFCDNNGTLFMGTQTYVNHLLANYEKLFGYLPHPVFSALTDNDCPELDTTPMCSPNDITKYQSLIGTCQWLICLVQLDLAEPIMLLSWFHHCPQQGHLDHLNHLCGYLCKFPHNAIHFHTGCPAHEDYYGSYTWQDTIYGSEELPPNAPTPCGKPVRHTCFFNTNLLHDVVTSHSATGLLHMLNQTQGHATAQNQVETVTYGSEFMAAHHQAVEQVINIHYTFDVQCPLRCPPPPWVLGDNQAIINSMTIPVVECSFLPLML